MADEGAAGDVQAEEMTLDIKVPKLKYHAVPVILLNEEGDLTEFDIRDKLRVCFEDSEEASDKGTDLKVLNQEELDALLLEGEERESTTFSKLLERQIEKDKEAFEQGLYEEARAAALEAQAKAEEEKQAAEEAEGEGEEGEAKSEEKPEETKPDDEPVVVQAEDIEKAEEKVEEKVVQKTCIYICKYALEEHEIESSSLQTLRYPVCAVLYIHSKAEEPAEEADPEAEAVEKSETEKLFRKFKEISVTKDPDTWVLDVALIECEAVDQSSYESLKTELLRISDCLGSLKDWQDSTLFLNVPEVEDTRSFGYYNQLMDSIPLSSCSVPVLLHCVLEQVTQNAEKAVGTPQKSMADEAALLFDSIISNMEDDPLPPAVASEQVDVVFELSQTLKGSPRKTRKKVSNAVIDPVLVEGEMGKLAGIPGTENFVVKDETEISEEDRATRMTSKEYFCQKHNLALSTLEHYEQLSTAVECLPENLQEMYKENIMGRRHLEILDSASAVQSILHCSSVLPKLTSKYLELEEATLLVLSANSADDPEPKVELPLPVRLQKVVNGGGSEDPESWPTYVYDVRVPAAEILERNSPQELHPTKDSRLCIFSDESWTLYKGINTLHYGESGLRGTTSDGSSIYLSSNCTQVALEEGVILNVNEDGTLSFTSIDEKNDCCWTVLPGGSIVKSDLKTGDKTVMLPDGCIGKYESESDSWCRINSAGAQWKETPIPTSSQEEETTESPEDDSGEPEPAESEAAVDEAAAEEGDSAKSEEAEAEAEGSKFKREDLPTLSIAVVRDPDTGANVSTREDLTMMIQYEEGHKLSLFSDGTRMITYSSGVWETMLQLKNVSVLFRGSGDQISIGKLSFEKSETEGIKIKMPFDSSVLEVNQKAEDISVVLGDFTADVKAGTLSFAGDVLWEKVKPDLVEESAEEEAENPAESAAEGEEGTDNAPEETNKDSEAAEQAEEETGEETTEEAQEEGAEKEEEEVLKSAKPRLFKIYESGHAVEFIDQETFESIAKKAASRGDQHLSETAINNSETSTVPVSHTFLSESDLGDNKGIVVAQNIAGESQAPRALQTLTVPSAITFAYVGNHTVPLPMISAIPSDAETFPEKSRVLLVRQIQEFPKLEEGEIASIQEVMKDLQEFDVVNEETSPSTYMVSESPLGSSAKDIQQKISETSEKIKRLRLSKKEAEEKKDGAKINGTKTSGGKETSSSLLKEESQDNIRERPRPGVLVHYFGSEEAEEIALAEKERIESDPSEKSLTLVSDEESTVKYGHVQLLDKGLISMFRDSYNNVGVVATVLGMVGKECPESHSQEEWEKLCQIAQGICQGGGLSEGKDISFTGPSIQVQVRRHLLAKTNMSLDIVAACSKILKSQRYLELYAYPESISRTDAALEELFEILNCDFSYLSELFNSIKAKIPSDDKELLQAAEKASKTCSAVSLDYSIDSKSIFKHLRADILLAGAAGADMLDEILDSFNIEKKRVSFMQMFVEADDDDDGYLNHEQFKALVPNLNSMLLSMHAIESSEINEIFADGKISIADFLDYLFQKQTQMSPMYASELNGEATGFGMYSKSGGEDGEMSSFKDVLQYYETAVVSSNKLAPFVMNQEYLSIEGDTRRTLKTGLPSMQKVKLQEGLVVKYFQLSPAYLFLGRLNPGESATGKLSLQNVGPEAGRFNINKVAPPFELNYKPGLLAAGMTRTINIDIKIPQDLDPEQDCFCTEVVIRTECNILISTCVAKVNKAPILQE